jgi:hypothetical protein
MFPIPMTPTRTGFMALVFRRSNYQGSKVVIAGGLCQTATDLYTVNPGTIHREDLKLMPLPEHTFSG